MTKPGIIRGNLITASAGFFLASKGIVDWGLFIFMLVGTSLVIASACVINNYLDRAIDKKMARTKSRALVTKSVSPTNALTFAFILGVTGFLVLAFLTNHLTLYVGITGFLAYLILYSYVKRRSAWGTLAGTISGATPPVAGYVSVANQIDTAAVLLFGILVLWQMAHFYSIALFRLNEYKAGGIPVLPAVKGTRITKIQIMLYIIALAAFVPLLSEFGYTGYTFLIVSVGLCLWWLFVGQKNLNRLNSKDFGKKMFLTSLTVLLGISLTLSLENFLP